MDQRLASDIKVETKAGNALARPTPQRRRADTFDDLRRLLHVVETVSFAVDIGCGLLHPHRRRYSEEEFKPDVRGLNRSP